ncbi:MAG: GGDEF domain-containing protein [Clostridia bacterium]|nr:GGDEF domain-containing protein [Clostridia bacterium]
MSISDKIIGALLTVSVIASAVFLCVSYTSEAPLSHSFDALEHVAVVGTYRMNNENETFALTSGSQIISTEPVMVINGNFTQDIPSGMHVVFRVDNANITICVNDEEVYASVPSPPFSSSGGNYWDGFVSGGISATDTVTVRIENIYSFRSSAFDSFLSTLHFGSTQQLITKILNEHTVSIIISITVLLTGLFMLITTVLLWIMKTRFLSGIYLSLMFIYFGGWFLIDFNYMSFLFPLPVSNNILDMTLLSFLLPLTLLYVVTSVKAQFSKFAYGVAALDCVYILTALALQLSGVVDFYGTVPVFFIMLLITGLTILFITVYEAFVLKKPGAKFLFFSMLIPLAGGMLDALSILFHLASEIRYVRAFIIVFIFILLIRLIVSFKRIIAENTRASILREMAYSDALTGLSNKAAYNQIAAAIERKPEDLRRLTVAVLDINGLKRTNDHFGHEAGDVLLKDCAKIIRAVFAGHTVYRIGGDEFVVLLLGEPISCSDYYKALAAEIKNAPKNTPVTDGIACGFASFEKGDTSVADIFRRADEEMYKDKHKPITI